LHRGAEAGLARPDPRSGEPVRAQQFGRERADVGGRDVVDPLDQVVQAE
jgi:hypothetical protein